MSEGNGSTPLPPGWASMTLGQCATRITDGTHLPPKFSAEGIPFLFVKHIVEGRLTFEGTKFIPEATYRELNDRCPVEIGDVLYTAVGSYGVAVPVDTDRPFSFQRHIAHIKPLAGLDTKYLSYCLNSPACVAQAHKLARGVAQKTVTLGDLRRFEVLIAPFPEQRRIVAKIEELFSDLDAGVAALKRVRANLKRYRAAVLKAAVEGRLTEAWRRQNPPTEPADKLLERILTERRKKWEEGQLRKYAESGKTPPKGWREKYSAPAALEDTGLAELPANWRWTNLGQLKQFAMYGPRFSSDAYASDGKLVLRTTDFSKAGRINFDTPPRLPLSDEAFAQYKLESGDLLVTRTGSIGTLAVFPGGADAIAGAFLIYYRLPLPITTIWYLFYFLKSPSGQRHLLRRVAGVGRPNLNMPAIDGIPIPLPPLEEQEQIIAEVERRLSVVEAVEAEIDHGLKRAARLRQAILKRAFEGKLVPQDPSDEPATAIMEGIRTGTVGEEGPSKARSGTRGRKERNAEAVG